MNKKEEQRLREWLESELGEDWDTFDLHAEQDLSLTYEENKTIISEKIKPLKEQLEIKRAKEEYESEQLKVKQEFKNKWLTKKVITERETLDKFKVIAIYGETGTGKTALAYKLLEQYKDRPVFFVKHPQPDLIKSLGYANLTSIEEMQRLQDCVCVWDEPQLSVSIYDHHSNRIISNVCSLARQRNVKLIIISSDTRVFSRGNEAYFDLWLVKDLCFSLVKNGSVIKKAIKDNSMFDPDGFRLEENEFVAYNRKYPELNGKHNFDVAKTWNEKLSTPYRNSQNNSQ